jgi:hypothetical protein
MKSPYERLSMRLGRSIWRGTAMSMPRTADGVCWSVICGGGGKPSKVMLKNSRVLGSLTWTEFPRTNGEANRAANWTDIAVKCEVGVGHCSALPVSFRQRWSGDAIRFSVSVRRGWPQPSRLVVGRSSDERRREWELGAFAVSLRSFRWRFMRSAQIAPLAESVPPKFYGGTERVVAWLVDELVEMGHEVTLFASGDSRTPWQARAGLASCPAPRAAN